MPCYIEVSEHVVATLMSDKLGVELLPEKQDQGNRWLQGLQVRLVAEAKPPLENGRVYDCLTLTSTELTRRELQTRKGGTDAPTS